MPTIRLIGSDFKQNVGAGFAAVHYDHQVGPLEQRRLRIYNESIEVYRCRLHDNRRAALLIQSPFHAMSEAPLANITYSVNLTDIRGNELGGIIQVSQDTFPANNVFHWLMADNNVIDNRRGGFEIALPRPGNHITDERNSVFIRNNTFTTNRNFAIIIGGHFARLEARFNRLMDNVCQRGLWSVEGTEKEILIEENLFERNRCKFILEVNADSHLEQFGIVSATFRRNRLQNNQYTFDDIHKSAAMLDYQPRSYTVGLRGLQKANITNNIFSDNALDYEFLAGIETGSLDCIINVRENWWGTTDAREIRRRIFDFDDWNSFAVADFSPFSQVKILVVH